MSGTGAPPPHEPPTWRPYRPSGTPEVEDEAGAPVRRNRTGALGGVGLALAGIAAGTWGIVALATNGDDGPSSTTTSHSETDVRVETDTQTFSTTSGIDVFAAENQAKLVAALRDRTGSSQALEVSYYPGGAVVTVPDRDGAQMLIWNGTLLASIPGGSVRRPFDLADLDGAVLAELCDDASHACAASVARPLPSDDGAWIRLTRPGSVARTDLQGKPV